MKMIKVSQIHTSQSIFSASPHQLIILMTIQTEPSVRKIQKEYIDHSFNVKQYFVCLITSLQLAIFVSLHIFY